MNIVAAVDSGASKPPPDLRSLGQGGGNDKSQGVDAYWYYVYENLAEPMAEGCDDQADFDAEEDTMPEMVGGPDVCLSRIATQATKDLPKKWIPNCKLTDHYFEYKCSLPLGQQAASEFTFRSVWKTSWRGILRIRGVRQHARCATCAELTHKAKTAVAQDDRQCALDALHHHREDFGWGAKCGSQI